MERSSRLTDVSNSSPLRVALVAAGTGGHIMPALALADALGNIGRQVEVEYICGNRPVELELYRHAGIEPRVFPVGSMSGAGGLAKAGRALGLGYSFAKSLSMMRRYDVAVGMGGYLSGPVLSAAALCRVPVVLHDSNTILGRANELMAKRAQAIACGLPLVEKPQGVPDERLHLVGTPVRLSVLRGDRAAAAGEMYFDPEGFTLLITGGSQGARGLNSLMARTLGCLNEMWPEPRRMQVVWSAGSGNLEAVRAEMEENGVQGQTYLAPSIERMDWAYAMADLVISRAGGSTLAEILACAKPSLLVPLPTSKNDHQRHNAEHLEKGQAALIFNEENTDPRRMAAEIASLVREPLRLTAMSEAARRLARPDAARDLAHLVIEAAEKRLTESKKGKAKP